MYLLRSLKTVMISETMQYKLESEMEKLIEGVKISAGGIIISAQSIFH